MLRLSERLRPRRAPAPTIDFARELPIGSFGPEQNPVSRRLYERLERDEIAQIEQLAIDTPELREWPLEPADRVVRRQLELHFGMWLGLPAVAEKTGLSPEQPPEDVHSMARGPLAAAGGLYEADLVADALLAAGRRIEDVRCGLDFGCSSGRVVRVLAAAFREARWMGCDPNERAIEWAREHLPGVEFFVSGDEPPLPIETGAADLAFAISIWSHFEPRLGLRWFDEMHRLIGAGGNLVFTTHGLTSIAHYAAHGLRGPEQCEQIADALNRRGWWYAEEFGDAGDWGIVNASWGTAFLSPEWLLSELCPRWRVVEFAAGRNASNQDVYVLERA
jgi:SAM-dependent methyltransferase